MDQVQKVIAVFEPTGPEAQVTDIIKTLSVRELVDYLMGRQRLQNAIASAEVATYAPEEQAEAHAEASRRIAAAQSQQTPSPAAPAVSAPEGYVIARSKNLTEFFTAASAYDCAKWVDVDGATVYISETQAAEAVKKLWKTGQFQAKLVTLAEAKKKKNPSEEIVKKDHRKQADTCHDVKKPAMVEMAGDEECEMVVPMVGAEQEEKAYRPARFIDGAHVEYKGESYTVRKTENGVATLSSVNAPDVVVQVNDKDPEVREVTQEAFKMPARPAGDKRQDTPGDQHPPNLDKEPYKVADTMTPGYFKDPTYVKQSPQPQDDLNMAVGMDHDEVVRVPAELKKMLRDTIKEFSDLADWHDGKGDDDAAYCKTVANALNELGEILHFTAYENEEVTVGCVKKAQIFLNSLMGPIAVRIPEPVRDWIYYGGRRKSLKDLYNLARDKSEAELMKNVRGDQWRKSK